MRALQFLFKNTVGCNDYGPDVRFGRIIQNYSLTVLSLIS